MFGIGVPVRQFHSKIRGPGSSAVLFLGAGASVQVGGPLVRGFIDLARDGIRHDEFSSNEKNDIVESLRFYDNLKISFSLTEEDIENVESLLAFADLSPMITTGKVKDLFPQNISQRLRGFVTSILKRNVQLPYIHSPEWVGLDKQIAIKGLIEALACTHGKLTIITLNYDCVMEYASYCMGLPFTYNANYSQGNGAEILKLHGSLNWFHCINQSCKKTWISSLKFCPKDEGQRGSISTPNVNCPKCESEGEPIIVPPTWGKSLNFSVLHDTWSRAIEVLERADTFVSIGYSLPISDQHVRNLLHLGFSSGHLRQGYIIVGNDDDAVARWASLFRPWWRNAKLKVSQSNFEDVLRQDLFAGLAIPDVQTRRTFSGVLPVTRNPFSSDMERDRVLNSMSRNNVQHTNGLAGVDWSAVQKEMRQTPTSNAGNMKVLRDCNYDWKPDGQILPLHGELFANT